MRDALFEGLLSSMTSLAHQAFTGNAIASLGAVSVCMRAHTHIAVWRRDCPVDVHMHENA
jgi:hypothetical protein